MLDVEDQRELQHSVHSAQLKAPAFVQGLQDYNCETELGRSYFEARVEPPNDPSLSVQWLKDGQSLANANRIQVGSSASEAFLKKVFIFFIFAVLFF